MLGSFWEPKSATILLFGGLVSRSFFEVAKRRPGEEWQDHLWAARAHRGGPILIIGVKPLASRPRGSCLSPWPLLATLAWLAWLAWLTWPFGLKSLVDLTDLIGLTDLTDLTGLTGLTDLTGLSWPDWPDWPEWPDWPDWPDCP